MKDWLRSKAGSLIDCEIAEIEPWSRQNAKRNVREVDWPAEAPADIGGNALLISLHVKQRRDNNSKRKEHYQDERQPMTRSGLTLMTAGKPIGDLLFGLLKIR